MLCCVSFRGSSRSLAGISPDFDSKMRGNSIDPLIEYRVCVCVCVIVYRFFPIVVYLCLRVRKLIYVCKIERGQDCLTF